MPQAKRMLGRIKFVFPHCDFVFLCTAFRSSGSVGEVIPLCLCVRFIVWWNKVQRAKIVWLTWMTRSSKVAWMQLRSYQFLLLNSCSVQSQTYKMSGPPKASHFQNVCTLLLILLVYLKWQYYLWGSFQCSGTPCQTMALWHQLLSDKNGHQKIIFLACPYPGIMYNTTLYTFLSVYTSIVHDCHLIWHLSQIILIEEANILSEI